VVILRHTDEVNKPLGTARIAKLSLSHCQVLDGVDFRDCHQFQSLIQEKDSRQLVLLYPGMNAARLKPIKTSAASGEGLAGELTLVLLDGTWRNTREILLCNPILQELPKATMPYPASRYIIRKSPAAGCVSTIEALAYALDYLHHEKKSFVSLLDAFDYMVSYQIKRMGDETFKKNYGDK
jgi:DTW domain-containing protein YfiP